MAELKPDDDPVAFFQRADEALYRAKAGGKGRAEAEQQSVEKTAP
jgi:PleD family two-component response regulator